MTLAQARALLHDDEPYVVPYAPQEDARKLATLARWFLRFSPTVSAQPPDGVFLDISGCARLFGGESRHLAEIDGALHRLGFPARIACAPSYAAAWALARYGPQRVCALSAEEVEDAVAPLPIVALQLDGATHAALAELDVRFVGELLRLPRAELLARFGEPLLQRLDETLARENPVVEPLRAAPVYQISQAYEGAIQRIEIIEDTIETLLDSLLGVLRRDERGVCDLAIEFSRIDAEPVCESFRFTQPTTDFAHLWRLIHPRLERVHLGHGVEEIRLHAVRTARLPCEQLTFWPATDEQAGRVELGVLLDRLVENLGREQVQCVAPVETYVPEHAFAFAFPGSDGASIDTSVQDTYVREPSATGVRAGGAVMLPAVRPSQMFDPPEPAGVISRVPDGPPAWLRWRGVHLRILCGSGPERIALRWWSGGEGHAGTRDYYTVRDEFGRALWVFRERIGLSAEPGQWYVHGLWA